jgi:hypothetical protein
LFVALVPTAPALAQEDQPSSIVDPWGAGITLADLPAGFTLSEDYSRIREAEGMSAYMAFYQRRFSLEPGPIGVFSVLAELDPSLGQEMLELFTSTVIDNLGALTLAESEGPSIGGNTRWFFGGQELSDATMDIELHMYMVVFQVDNRAAMLGSMGLSGLSTQDDLTQLASLVSERLTGASTPLQAPTISSPTPATVAPTSPVATPTRAPATPAATITPTPRAR